MNGRLAMIDTFSSPGIYAWESRSGEILCLIPVRPSDAAGVAWANRDGHVSRIAVPGINAWAREMARLIGPGSGSITPSHESGLTVRPRSCRVRRGLAPLELVLALPILLFLMALMINFGTVAAWKVRSLAIARHQLWGNSPGHSLSDYPRPEFWPNSAGMDSHGLNDITSLGDVGADPAQLSPGGFTFYDEVLDPSRGAREGTASLDRRFPLLGKFQSYQLNASAMFLDDKWQYWRMYWHDKTHAWYGRYWSVTQGSYARRSEDMQGNRDLRIPVIYGLSWAANEPSLAMMNAANELDGSAMKMLNNWDEEDIAYRIRFPGPSPLFPKWKGLGDLHPRLRQFCSADPDVAQEAVDSLVRRIDNVPHSLAFAFDAMYNFVLPYSTDPSEIAWLQQQIAFLDQYLKSH